MVDTSPGLVSVTPINDLHGPDAPALAKGERLMRCKVGSIHRLLDLYGWAQLGHAAVTVSTPAPGGDTTFWGGGTWGGWGWVGLGGMGFFGGCGRVFWGESGFFGGFG